MSGTILGRLKYIHSLFEYFFELHRHLKCAASDTVDTSGEIVSNHRTVDAHLSAQRGRKLERPTSTNFKNNYDAKF